MSTLNTVLSRKVITNQVISNISQGNYQPAFFDLQAYRLSRVEFNSLFFNQEDVEKHLLEGRFSFGYIRENKLRTIDAFDSENNHIAFSEFLKYFGITIRSKNLFKTGKYLSRVFRPTRFSSYYKDLDVYINESPKYSGKVTDGISLISIDLARSLGWEKAQENMSAQFTLFFNDGMVKGHCIVSSKIKHDIIIYGRDNIKDEITLNNGYEYVAIEPVKLGRSLRMDIQSMLNLWNLFGAEQFLSWAYTGMQNFKKDLLAGKLSDYLDNFDEIDRDDYDKEKWTLRKAIWAKVDYTKYPGLIRLGWSMMKNSIMRYADNLYGQPVFRIPVPNGKRGYIRVDLRNHDENGDFSSTVEKDSVELDRYGNLWINQEDVEEFMAVKGGADMDDSVAIIPIEGNKAVIYRNPNQYGEYGIHNIKADGVDLVFSNVVIGDVPMKQIKEEKNDFARECFSTGNPLLDSFLQARETTEEYFLEYNLPNLIRTYTRILDNTASIGVAANAEMIRSAVGITKPKLLKKLSKDFSWNLERIIDSTVKDGIDAKDDMEAVRGLFEYVAANKIKVPGALLNRFPEKMQADVVRDTHHPMDLLLDAIKILIDRTDIEILGKGSASKANRIPGIIDRLETPVVELGLGAVNSPLYSAAISLLKDYNKQIAILLESTKAKENKELLLQDGIERIQTGLLEQMNKYSGDERSLIINVMAYEIYKSSSSVHDSILWISDKEELKGTAGDMIKMLAYVKLAYHIKKNGTISRYQELKQAVTELKEIRVWSKDTLRAEDFSGTTEVLIEGKTVLINDIILNIGDECQVNNGYFKVKTIVQACSRKDNGTLLKNSLSVYLA